MTPPWVDDFAPGTAIFFGCTTVRGGQFYDQGSPVPGVVDMVAFRNLIEATGLSRGALWNYMRKLKIEEQVLEGRWFFPKPGTGTDECVFDARCFLGSLKLVFQFKFSETVTAGLCLYTPSSTSSGGFLGRMCGLVRLPLAALQEVRDEGFVTLEHIPVHVTSVAATINKTKKKTKFP